VSRIFADAARRSTLAVCTALSANRPLVSSRHHTLNDLVPGAFVAAGVPVATEPSVGLLCKDAKRPDGLSLIPFEGCRSLTWDVTVVCSTADSDSDLGVLVLAVWRRWQLLE